MQRALRNLSGNKHRAEGVRSVHFRSPSGAAMHRRFGQLMPSRRPPRTHRRLLRHRLPCLHHHHMHVSSISWHTCTLHAPEPSAYPHPLFSHGRGQHRAPIGPIPESHQPTHPRDRRKTGVSSWQAGVCEKHGGLLVVRWSLTVRPRSKQEPWRAQQMPQPIATTVNNNARWRSNATSRTTPCLSDATCGLNCRGASSGRSAEPPRGNNPL